MWQTVKLGFVAAAAALGVVPDASAQDANDIEINGQALYRENCAICHGENGKGDGSLARQLSPPPRDFTKSSFRFRSTDLGEPPAAIDLLKTMTLGIEGSYGRSMPPFPDLTFDQKVALLEVIQEFADIDQFGISMAVPPRPEGASAEKGQALFVEHGCAQCHGVNGDGNGILAGELRDDQGSIIMPANLQTGLFKGGSNPEDIWMRLQTGLPGTPMPSFGRSLSVEESWSLVEYVLEIGKSE